MNPDRALNVSVNLYWFVLILMFMLLMASAARAEDVLATGYTINIQGPLDTFINLVFAALSAVATGILGFFFGKKGKIKTSDETLQHLSFLVAGALQLAKSRVMAEADKIKDPTVQSHIIASALNSLLLAVPNLLVRFNISETTLESMIRSRLLASIAVNGNEPVITN